jgi:hypothetical protein
MGKGTLALAPFHSEGLMHRVAFAGLLTTMHACLDMKNSTQLFPPPTTNHPPAAFGL